MVFQINELRESNEFLNLVIDNITSAVFFLDHKTEICNFNDAFQALFQIQDDYVIGQRCGEGIGCHFVYDEKKRCGETSHCGQCILRKSILLAITEKIPVYRKKMIREFYIKGKKILKYVQFTTRHIIFNNEKMILIIIDDITEIEKQEKELEEKNEKLRQLNQQKNEFLGIASHDIRNPVGIIQMYSDFMIKEKSNNLTLEQKKYLTSINQSAEFISNLLNDLLDISKIQSGRLDLELNNNSYDSLVSHNIEMNQVIARKKHIELELIKSSNIPKISIDRNKIEQVLNNLISNAIKYSFPDTVITVKISCTNSFILTEVIDQGQGIPDNELENIFEPFQKTSIKSTAGEKSTGLGLTIVKKIIERHGGNIGVKSKLGKGTCFYFELPVLTSQQKLLKQDITKKLQSLKQIWKIKILLVEDNPDNQFLIGLLLKKLEITCDIAENGRIAFYKAQKYDYDLIFMDLEMPEMNGYECIQKLRENNYTKPVIALTAHETSEIKEKCLKEGFDAHMTKPINRKKLRKILADFLVA